jgi:hypothetical protein
LTFILVEKRSWKLADRDRSGRSGQFREIRGYLGLNSKPSG